MVTLEEEGAELFKRFLDWLKRYLAEPPAPPPPPPVGVVPHILDGPKDAVLGPGGFATFTVLSEGTPPLAYQWFGNGTAIPGAISPTFSVSHSDALRFVGVGKAKLKVTVTNRFGVDSREAVITIQPEKEEPPPPPPPPPPDDDEPRADGVKIGFRASVPKARGFRNTFDITPTLDGQAIKPESGWGPKLIEKYGEFEGFQTGPWQGRDPVERQSDNPYIFVIATNSDEENWTPDGRYKLAGEYVFGVSWPHLKTWRCQKGRMTDRGQLVGFGTNSQGFDLPK